MLHIIIIYKIHETHSFLFFFANPLIHYFHEFVIIFVMCEKLIESILKRDLNKMRLHKNSFNYIQLDFYIVYRIKINFTRTFKNKYFQKLIKRKLMFDQIRPKWYFELVFAGICI